MALDTATVSALCAELSGTLRDGRIEKIQQPEKDLLLLTVRAEGENRKLLIRAAGPNARAHLTTRSYENPKEAPMFCMLLRKYLTGARIREVEQPNGDRLLCFGLESRNELGDSAELQLIVELMGRAANVVLVGPDGRILDCLRRIPPSEHGTRALLPGLRYELPPLPEGFYPKPGSGDRDSADFTPDQPATPATARTSAQAALQTAPQTEASDSGKAPSDRCTSRDADCAVPSDGSTGKPGVSELLDRRCGAAEQQELQRRRAQELVRTVRRARDRQQRKLSAQTEELRRTEKLEQIRREAELLQANLYRVRRGDRVLECENYYEEDAPTAVIPLDPVKTPQENLAARFREYRKLKGAKEHLTQILADGEKQLDYLNSVLEELDRAGTSRELEEIRSELESTGFIRTRQKTNQKKRSAAKMLAPLRFESPDGLEILVGRNNLQNDELTTRIARRTDYWFHVQQLHGSHVILRCEGTEPSPEALQAAAELAAGYSQAGAGSRTAVDYTMVLNVRKPSGALPGKVIYRNYRTVIVNTRQLPEEGETP